MGDATFKRSVGDGQVRHPSSQEIRPLNHPAVARVQPGGGVPNATVQRGRDAARIAHGIGAGFAMNATVESASEHAIALRVWQ